MMEMISVNKIWPHPDNPRKDLGDLTELAESIKAKGILQNLTVVPLIGNVTNEIQEGCYRAVIGHRRLAAAKLAGLTEVPCSISYMNQREQVATMLMENMQRSDLTICEQANGFQMMLNLGETYNEISEQTGFSESTVRKRVKLLELDQKKLQQAMERGGTLMDYAELDKVKDAKLKNKVLEAIGTSNFKWILSNAIEEEEMPIRKAELIKILDEFAEKTNSDKGLTYIKMFHSFSVGSWEKPKDADKAEYLYKVEGHGITLYKKEANKAPAKQSAEDKAFIEREEKLKDLTRRAYESRYNFVENFNGSKKHSREIMEFVVHKLISYGNVDMSKTLDILDIKFEEQENMQYYEKEKLKRGLILERYEEQPEKVLLACAYLGGGDYQNNGFYNSQSWLNKIIYKKNESLDYVYEKLIELGYEISDEEVNLRYGTHELFDAGETK